MGISKWGYEEAILSHKQRKRYTPVYTYFKKSFASSGDHRSERGSDTNSSLRSDSMSNANSRRVGSGRIRPSASTSEEYEGGPSSRDQRGGGGRSNYGERGDSASESRYGFNRGVDRGDR